MYKKFFVVALLTVFCFTQNGIVAKAMDYVASDGCNHNYTVHTEVVNGWYTSHTLANGETCNIGHQGIKYTAHCTKCGAIGSTWTEDRIVSHSNPNCPDH